MIFFFNSVQWILSSEANATDRELLSDFNRVFEMEGQSVSSGRFCRTIKVAAGNHPFYYVKRYHVRLKGFWKAFGRSRPMVEARNVTYFARLGIPVPQIVGYGRQRILGLFIRGAIVTKEVPQAIDLQTLFRTRADLWKNRPWFFQVLRLVANYVWRIHEDGFTHGDLKWRNILVTTMDEPCVFFIDCPRGGRKSSFSWRQFVVKDLASLDRPAAKHLSRATRLRFYLWYRNETRLTQENKALIARVMTAEG
jgi:tRNA A-37 threonylcarbamoyl transferase component Bud32